MSPDAITVIRHDPDRDLDETAAVLQALAEEPSAVVYDLTTSEGKHAQLSSVFDAVDPYLAQCSGTPLLVCTADPAIASTLRAHSLGARVTTWASPDAALAAAQRLPLLDRYTLDLDPVPTAPRQARALVRQALDRWETPHLVGAAWSVITELVTNAVTHAATPLTASISRPRHDHGTVRLAVRDGDSTTPVLLTPTHPLTTGGLGIWIVNNDARGWGTVPLNPGKIVWAVLGGRSHRAD